jgi:hypothetical protein
MHYIQERDITGMVRTFAARTCVFSLIPTRSRLSAGSASYNPKLPDLFESGKLGLL